MAYDPTKSKWGPRLGTYGETRTSRRVLVYGDSGVGKTTFAAGAPAPVFIDADYGENAATRGLPYMSLDRADPFGRLRGFLLDALASRDVWDEGGPLASVATIVIDSWTKVNELLMWQIATEGTGAKGASDLTIERLPISGYGILLSRQVNIMTLLKELSLKRNLNIVVTALPAIEGDAEERMTKAKPGEVDLGFQFKELNGIPNMVGQYKSRIGAEFDEIYYLEAVETMPGRVTRRMHTQRHGIWIAKTRSALAPVVADPTWSKLFPATN